MILQVLWIIIMDVMTSNRSNSLIGTIKAGVTVETVCWECNRRSYYEFNGKWVRNLVRLVLLTAVDENPINRTKSKQVIC